MKKLLIFIVALTLTFTIGVINDPAFAGKNNNGNGFPEGDHYNLNLIAKKSDPSESGYFTCPSPEDYLWDYYKDNMGICTPDLIGTDACEKCDPYVEYCPVVVESSRNVIFVPRDNDVDGNEVPDMDITIRIKSGSERPGKGKKISDEYPVLAVTDWCTEHFPDDKVDGDMAEVMLPENANGYGVYARATGRPIEGVAWRFLIPTIESAQDEYENDLYHMGNIGPDGCVDAAGNYIGDIDRVDKTKGNGKGNGVKEATYLDCLFKFVGQICYINDICQYCGDPVGTPPDYPLCDEGIFDGNDAGYLCCENTYDDDGYQVFDSCSEPAKSNCVDPVGMDGGGFPCDPNTSLDPTCVWTCLGASYDVDPVCRDYQEEPTWVFNIADFVDVLWKSETNGAYVIQLRFYPL